MLRRLVDHYSRSNYNHHYYSSSSRQQACCKTVRFFTATTARTAPASSSSRPLYLAGNQVPLRMSSTNSTGNANRNQDEQGQGQAGEKKKKIMFGPFEVTSQVFLTTPHSFALVNLKPLLPGHVLVCPVKPHRRLTELSGPEVTDLFSTVQRVQRMLVRHYFKESSQVSAVPSGGSFNIALQDGPEAGQTVAHVHVHVIPRIANVNSKPDDGTEGDELYEKMAGEEGNVGGALWDRQVGSRRPQAGGKFDRIEDSARKARSMEEMEAEAEVFMKVLRELEAEEGR